MSYTVTQRNPNSWTQHNDGSQTFEIVRECGHKHRTLDGALRCKESFGNSELGYFGMVEKDGAEVQSGPELWAAMQRVYDSRR